MEGWIIAGAVASMVAALGVIFVILTWLVTKRMDTRETSSRDVVWAVHRSDPGEFTLTNMGSISALDVAAVLMHDQETEVSRADTVIAGGHLVVRSDVDAELRRQASEEWDAYERARQTSPYPPVIPGTHRSTIRLLVSWTYPSGLAEKQHLEWVEEY